jgi:hypothetical protein
VADSVKVGVKLSVEILTSVTVFDAEDDTVGEGVAVEVPKAVSETVGVPAIVIVAVGETVNISVGGIV